VNAHQAVSWIHSEFGDGRLIESRVIRVHSHHHPLDFRQRQKSGQGAAKDGLPRQRAILLREAIPGARAPPGSDDDGSN
jgi:hypothetical protein